MVQYKPFYELKNTAKDKLDGKYTGTILILLLSSLITNILTVFVDSVGSGTVNSVYYATESKAACNIVIFIFGVLLLTVHIICAVMNAGIALYFLNIACGQPFALKNLFYGFRNDSKKSLAIAAVMVVCQTVCFGPFRYLAQNLLDTRDLKWLPYAAAAFFIGSCVYFPTALGITLSFYLMLDFPQKSAGETLSLCWRVMKGHKRRLFLLKLSFLPLILLCILSFGVGFLWLDPYMQMTYTYFFLDLMNPKKEGETV